jgi:4-amino-4-deoxy-L-arabinose transferase-like glycosyltransferase
LLKGVSRKYWAALFVLFLAGAIARLCVVPHQHYVYYDEYEHMNIAQNMAQTGAFSQCEFYLDGKCVIGKMPRWMPGYHFMLSRVFRIWGSSEEIAYRFNGVVSALSIVLVFLASYLFFLKKRAALIAAFFFAFFPLSLKFSGSASSETMSLFAILSAFAGLGVFWQKPDGRSLFLAIAGVAFASLFRMENTLLIALAVWLMAVRRTDRKRWARGVAWMVLCVPAIVLIAVIGKTYSLNYWMAGPSDFHAALTLFLNNLLYWARNTSVPLALILLAVAGIAAAKRIKPALAIWLGAYFLLFLGVYTFFLKAHLDTTSTQRLNLQFCLPVIIFAALGLDAVLRFIRRYDKTKWIMAAGIVSLIAVNHLEGLIHVFVPAAQDLLLEEHELVLSLKGRTDPSSVFVTYEPSLMMVVLNRSAINIAYMTDNRIYDRYLKGRCLYLYKDTWCRQDKDGLCSAFQRRMRLTTM